MTEKCDCSMTTELNHIKEDFRDFKTETKESLKDITSEMLNFRDNKIRTENTLEAIKQTQVDTNASQKLVLDKLQEIKDAPHNTWKQLSKTVQYFIIAGLTTYFGGCLLGVIKMFTK